MNSPAIVSIRAEVIHDGADILASRPSVLNV